MANKADNSGDTSGGWGVWTNLCWGVHVSRNRPYAYDVTVRAPSCVGGQTKLCHVRHRQACSQGGKPCKPHFAGLARPGPRTERLSANVHCQHNTCALRDTRLASLLWRCDPLWRQCIRSIGLGFYLLAMQRTRIQQEWKSLSMRSCCGSVDKAMDSHLWGPRFESAGSGSSALGQGTLSSLPSPSERT